MSNIEVRDAKARDNSDWNRAWKAVSQLAEARGATLREISKNDRNASIPGSPTDPRPGSDSAAISAAPFARMAPDQLARDIAEIEQAAEALRRAEPALQQRSPATEASSEARPSRSIWILICVIWLTAVLVVSCAAGAVMLLFG